MRIIIIALLLIFKLSAFAQNKPNIIFILVDDQRYDLLSFLDHPMIETPNIDRLIEESIYFNQAFVTTSLCSPSRASILTGQYAHTHKVMDNRTPLPMDTNTFPKELKNSGYNTAFIGKWHMGSSDDMPRPGFDRWVSFKGQGNYIDPVLNVDGNRVQMQGHMTDILTDFAEDYIKSKKINKEPYFLYVSHKAIHFNFEPAKRHKGLYKDLIFENPPSFADTEENYRGKPAWLKRLRNSWQAADIKRILYDEKYESLDGLFQCYNECMAGIDESVGRITKELEKQGKLDETVIIYYSDNGFMMGEHGLIDKRVMYDESIRVPAFVHWPEKIQKPSMNSEFILNIDIGPTILDLAGINKPSAMQGESFLPLMLGKDVDWREDFVYEYFIDPDAVQTPTIIGLRTKDYSYMTFPGVWDIYELYDMKNDPDQMNNLIGDVTYGYEYGAFMKFVEMQLPQIAPVVKKIDSRLTELHAMFGGSRQATWVK